MKITVIDESPLEPSLFGLGLSYGITSGKKFCEFSQEEQQRICSVAKKLLGKGLGHDKFLRQISVILDITAPSYWWPEMDQYKISTVTQSESKMHTLLKYPITQEMFERPIPERLLTYLEGLRKKKDFYTLLNILPHGWLQRRILSCNYAVLWNIIQQRKGHKLFEWKMFIQSLYDRLKYAPLLLPQDENNEN